MPLPSAQEQFSARCQIVIDAIARAVAEGAATEDGWVDLPAIRTRMARQQRFLAATLCRMHGDSRIESRQIDAAAIGSRERRDLVQQYRLRRGLMVRVENGVRITICPPAWAHGARPMSGRIHCGGR